MHSSSEYLRRIKTQEKEIMFEEASKVLRKRQIEVFAISYLINVMALLGLPSTFVNQCYYEDAGDSNVQVPLTGI